MITCTIGTPPSHLENYETLSIEHPILNIYNIICPGERGMLMFNPCIH